LSFWSVAEKIFSSKKKNMEKTPEEILSYSLLIDTAGISADEEGPVLSKYSVIIHNITMSCTVLSEARSANQLIDIIGNEVSKYPLKVFIRVMDEISETTKDMDEIYRRKLLKKIREQMLDTRHTIIMLHDKREYSDFLFSPGRKSGEYWLMVLEACRKTASRDDPSILYLKYLLAGFRMFALKEPAHPVGTPFFGGHEVEREYGKYFCPAKDEAQNVFYAVCPFCPAEQSSEFMLLYSKKQRVKKRRNQDAKDLQNSELKNFGDAKE